jgi:2-succinyl-6-hydroxy-2,4-cyclohexadiene-1-carboxylate synthase
MSPPSVVAKLPNLKWHWQIFGSRTGSPLLWLHGFMGSYDDWRTLVNEHFGAYCNILVDLPGHGQTHLPQGLEYSALLAQLKRQLSEAGFESFVPIGYSMGGRIALHLQQQFPESIPALVGLSTAPGLKTAQERQQRQDLDARLMQKLDQVGFATFLKDWYKLPLFQSIYQNDKLMFWSMATRSDNDPEQLRRALQRLGNGALPSLWQALPWMALPLLLISGSLDEKYCRINREMMTQLPQARHTILAGADHAFHLEKPLETTRLIKQFLSETIEGE